MTGLSSRRGRKAAPFCGPTMKLMIRTRAAVLSALLSTGIALAGGEGWNTDFEAAKKEAAASDKSLLVDFTGSDWCPSCIEMESKIFSQDAFKTGVKDKFVLMKVDLPENESKLPAAILKQNKQLKAIYPFEVYPSLFLMDAEGRPFAVTTYEQISPAAYVKHLDELYEIRKVRDEGFARAEKSEGVAKAKALLSALNAVRSGVTFPPADHSDEIIAKFYPGLEDQIKKADPADETGFAKRSESKSRLNQIQNDVNGFASKQDLDGALGVVDKSLKEGGLEPDDTQKVALLKGLILADQGKFAEASSAVEEARKIAPNSELVPKIEEIGRALSAKKAGSGGVEQ